MRHNLGVMDGVSGSVYLDYNGSTPVDSLVREAFLAALDGIVGNPSVAHAAGGAARRAIDLARAQIARGLGADSGEIWFTSGGTESNNWAVLEGGGRAPGRNHVVVSSIEHKSVLQAARRVAERGGSATFVDPEPNGRVAVADMLAALRPDTRLVALMLANNETGILQPVAELSAECRARGVAVLCDAVAAVGKLRIDVRELGCDFLSVSAHKLYSPKGVGVLYARTDAPLAPFVVGCGQQCGMRGGTENTAGVVALGRAFERMLSGAFDQTVVGQRCDRLWSGVRRVCPDARLNGAGPRLPNTLSVAFPGYDAPALQAALAARGVSVSSGAASADGALSHVLTAMKTPSVLARGTLRFSLGSNSTDADVEAACRALDSALRQLRPDPVSQPVHTV